MITSNAATASTTLQSCSAVQAGTPKNVRRLLSHLTKQLSDTTVPFSLELPNGECRAFGCARPEFQIALLRWEALSVLTSLHEGRIAEAFMDGSLDVQGDIVRMFDLRASLSDTHLLHYLWRFLHPLIFGQIRTNAVAIRAHYDLGPEFYLSYMDSNLPCYTQGIFARDDEPLHEATKRKFDFCLGACQLKAGSHALEVGPGWGAFATYAAERRIKITAVTNSAISKAYMDRLGITCNTHLADILEYDSADRYDAIVLMGIMEHLPDYSRSLAKFASLLKSGGRVYLDASAAREKYAASSFTYRHIYPGNHSFFVLHDFLSAVARSPFRLRGVHDDQHSYYLTFRQWAQNFEANRDRIIGQFGERNYRRFRLYLWGSAHSFLDDRLQCYRVVLEKPGG